MSTAKGLIEKGKQEGIQEGKQLIRQLVITCWKEAIHWVKYKR